MILAFSNDHWRTPRLKRRQNVIEDEIVPRRVLSKLCVKFLDGWLFIGTVPGKPEFCAAKNNLMVEGPSGRLLSCVNAMTNRAALHEDNRVVAILPRHRRRQAEHVLSPGLPRDGFEAHGGQVMAFVDDDMPIVGDQITDDTPPHQAL